MADVIDFAKAKADADKSRSAHFISLDVYLNSDNSEVWASGRQLLTLAKMTSTQAGTILLQTYCVGWRGFLKAWLRIWAARMEDPLQA